MSEHIGTRVSVPGTTQGYGILRYIGGIEGKSGVFAGLELQGPIAASRGKNNGSVDGIQYFEVSQPMSGLFLPWERLRNANPKLLRADRPQTRPSSVSSRSEMLYTPSPPTRKTSSRLSYLNYRDSGSRGSDATGRESPFSGPQQIHVTKRKSAINENNKSPALSTLSLLVGSRTSLGDLFQKCAQPQAELHAVLRELDECKSAMQKKNKELQEKTRILEELQTTIAEVDPVMEAYERSVQEKDQKLQRQRKEYDGAREEWRQSLDLMLSAQQEAETFYEQQIEDLKEEIGRLSRANTRVNSTNGEQLSLELQSLREENQQLKQEINKKGESNGLDGYKKEYVELLEKKVERLLQDISSLEFVIEDTKKKSKEKDAIILQLNYKLEEENHEVDTLLTKIESLTVKDLEQKEGDHQSQIAKLQGVITQNESKIMELKETVERKEKEYYELQKRYVSQEKVIQDMENLQAEQNSLIQHLQSASAKDSDNDIERNALLKQIENLKAELSSANERTVAYETKERELVNKLQEYEAKVKEQETKVKKYEQEEIDLRSQIQAAKETHPNDATAMEKQIEDLKHELQMRPSFDELNELHASLEEVDRLHTNELYLKDKELSSLREGFQKIMEENKNLQDKLKTATSLAALPSTPTVYGSKLSNGPSPGSGSLPDPESWAKTDSLPVYEPVVKSDPSEGREDWCGLCEREGHNSLDCPYENDIF